MQRMCIFCALSRISAKGSAVFSRLVSLNTLSFGLTNGCDALDRVWMRIMVRRVPWMRRQVSEVFHRQFDQRLFHRLFIVQCGCGETIGFVFVLSRVAVAPSKNLYVAGMTVGFAIGTVVSTILLTVLFVLVLPFFSLIVRAGDPLRRNLRASESHWGDYKPHEPTLDRMRRLF